MKKIICFLLVLLSVMCLSACKKDVTETGRTEKEGVSNLSKSVDFKTNGYVECCKYNEGFMYYVARIESKSSDISSDISFNIQKYNLETGEDTKLFDVVFKENETQRPCNINSIQINSDGNILLFYLYKYYPDATTSYYAIDKNVYGMDGVQKSTTTLEKDENISIALSSYIDSKENTYILTRDDSMTGSYLIRYDAAGKKTGVQKMSTDLDAINICDDKVVLEKVGENKTELGYYNIENNSFDTTPFKDLDISGRFNYSIVGMYGSNILILGEKYLYSYNCENNELKELISLRDNYLDFNSIDCIAQTGDDKFICVYSPENKGQKLMYFDPQTNDNSDKTSIRVASIDCKDRDFVDTIYDYNRSGNNDFIIDYKDYASDAKDPSTKLMQDIMTGNIPDIYIVNNMDYDNLVAKNMLEDLKPYIKKDDTLNKEYFIDGYLNSVSSYGKQYVLSKTFVLDVLCGNKEEVSKYKDGWTIEDMMNYYQSKQEGTFLLSDSSAIGIFNRLVSGNMDCFIDRKTGKCSFESDDFKKILEFSKSFNKPDYMQSNEDDKVDNIKNGKLLFLSDQVSDITDIQYNDAIFNGNSEYIGYPSTKDNGIYLSSLDSIFAISSGSEHKDIAWKLIKDLMTGDYKKYDYANSNIGIPVSKKEFDSMVRFKTATEKYTDEEGNEVEPIKADYNGIILGQPKQEEFDVLKEIISKSTFCNRNDSIVNIMADDINKYFDGSKSLEDTVNVIQDKMTKYVNENK